MARHQWTAAEDEHLREAVRRYGSSDWKCIAMEVPGRTNTQCLQRWSRSLMPGLKKGKWEPHEDTLLASLVKKACSEIQCALPKRGTTSDKLIGWPQLAQMIPGRTSKQCRERWYEHLSPDIKHGPFSREEDDMMTQQYRLLGNHWTQIADKLPGRTPDSIKLRIRSTLMRTKTSSTDSLSSQHQCTQGGMDYLPLKAQMQDQLGRSLSAAEKDALSQQLKHKLLSQNPAQNPDQSPDSVDALLDNLLLAEHTPELLLDIDGLLKSAADFTLESTSPCGDISSTPADARCSITNDRMSPNLTTAGNKNANNQGHKRAIPTSISMHTEDPESRVKASKSWFGRSRKSSGNSGAGMVTSVIRQRGWAHVMMAFAKLHQGRDKNLLAHVSKCMRDAKLADDKVLTCYAHVVASAAHIVICVRHGHIYFLNPEPENSEDGDHGMDTTLHAKHAAIAVEHGEKAIALCEDNAQVWDGALDRVHCTAIAHDTLSLALVQTGEHKRALQLSQRSLQLHAKLTSRSSPKAKGVKGLALHGDCAVAGTFSCAHFAMSGAHIGLALEGEATEVNFEQAAYHARCAIELSEAAKQTTAGKAVKSHFLSVIGASSLSLAFALMGIRGESAKAGHVTTHIGMFETACRSTFYGQEEKECLKRSVLIAKKNRDQNLLLMCERAPLFAKRAGLDATTVDDMAKYVSSECTEACFDQPVSDKKNYDGSIDEIITGMEQMGVYLEHDGKVEIAEEERRSLMRQFNEEPHIFATDHAPSSLRESASSQWGNANSSGSLGTGPFTEAESELDMLIDMLSEMDDAPRTV